MESSAIGAALVSLSGQWLYTNAAIRALLGFDEAELRQTTFQKLTHPDDLDADLDHLVKLLAGEIPSYQMEKRYITKSGAAVWTLLSVSMVRDAQDRPAYFISHVQDIGERRAAEAERQRLAEAAHAANDAKSLFLAHMSHEIRTPLNGILGMAQAMEAEPLPPDQQARLRVIRQSGDALLAILNDILDLSKIEAGRLELEDVDFDLGVLLADTYDSFATVAQDKGLAFILDLGDAGGVYRGDPTRVRQVMSNLISNALKFTATGEVAVRARRLDPGFELAVSDTGPGVPAEARARIFTKFMQADVSTTRKHGGTGLGLSICRDLVTRMGGDISLESEPGAGSTFRASFALKRLRDSAPRSENAAARAVFDDSSLQILVAEDNEVNQLVIRTLLGQAGVEPTIVGDGAAAVEAWERQAWDAVLMDIQMPVMDGAAATRAIRERERASGRARTPIIGLSANAMPHQTSEYMAIGMDACVAKPIDVRALLAALEDALDGAGPTGADALPMAADG